MSLASKPMWLNKKNTKSYCLIAPILIVILTCLIKIWHPKDKIALIVLLAFALLVLIIIVLHYRDLWGKRTAIYVSLAVLACLFKIFDGAFLDIFSRYFCEVLLCLLLGCYLLQPKVGFLSFAEVFLLLFVPQLIIFFPFFNVYVDVQQEFYPLLYTPILALLLLYGYYRARRKYLMLAVSVIPIALLAYVAYPNYFSHLQGKIIPAANIKIDERANLPLLLPNGTTTSIAQLGNKVVVLDVWYSGCGVCFRKFPAFERLSEMYATDTNVYCAAMNLPLEKELHNNEAFELVSEYKFKKIKSIELAKSNKWQIHGFPQTLIFDKQHRLRYIGDLNADKSIVVNNTLTLIEQLKKEYPN